MAQTNISHRCCRSALMGVVLALALLVGVRAQAQITFSTDFKGSTAGGWIFGGSNGSTIPYLTAAQNIDAEGQGWLRLTENLTNQSTYALLDDAIFSVNAQIQIEMEYAFYNGSGADGITFFLIDGDVSAQSFAAGAYGGSMGYAQKTNIAGMPGGYLGFAFDNWGNYSNNNEGRVGGIAGPGPAVDSTLYPNRIAVRGPESSNYAFIAASAALPQQMDFPSSTTRPDQTGVDYRSFRLTLDANNLLTVEMKFGASGSYTTAFTADLSTYDRPETFKLGFTGATGSATEIHEIRNLQVSMTPWQPTANEWDNGAGTTAWATATNWHGDALPGVNADILFGNKPASGPQTVALNSTQQLNSLTFDSSYNYTLGGTGAVTFGDPVLAGLPSINVNDYNGAQAQHKINVPITLTEQLRINNYSFSVLCINGTITTAGKDLTVNGWGAVNFNSDIIGSGNLVKNGDGIVTLNNNNADGATPWTGNVTLNKGLTVVTTDGALGTTAGTTTVNDGATLALRGGFNYATTESVTIKGDGILRGQEGLAGALYNDGGNNTFAGNVTLGANASVGSREGNLTLSGKVSDGAGTFSLTKRGEGVVTLSNTTNDWNGATVIAGGVLRITGGENALAGGFSTSGYSGGNLQLAGGVLEIGVGTTFTRRLGTGSDQVQWTGDGGFSASGADRTVTLANSAGTANGQLTWNSGSFVPTGNALVLSSDYADANLTLTNAIDLGGAQREVRVFDGSAAVDGTLSGNLTNGGLVKTGAGTLNLSGTNTYAGDTEIRAGALRGNISGSSNLVLAGGVRELTGDFTGSLGTGAGQVRWTGDGGFSASGGDRTVRINNSTAAVAWNSANFVADGSALVLGSNSASNTLIWDSGLDLAGGNRTIRVLDGADVEDARLNRAVSNGSLTVTGNGRLDSVVANTLAGTVTVSGAEFRLRSSGTLASVTGITVDQGGTFTMDNGATNNTDRVNNSATVTLDGGTISLLGRTGNNNTTETVGALTLAGGANTVNSQRGDANGSAQLTFASLTRNAGATVDFTYNASGTLGNTGDNPRVVFTTAPTLTSNVLGYATVNNGAAFAGYASVNNSSPDGIYAVAGTNTTQSSWTTSINAAPTSDQTLTANRTVGSLLLGSGIDVALGSNTLTINSGGLLSNGATGSIISGGTLRTGTGMDDLVTHVYGSGGLTISSVIADNSGARGLTKTGDGTLTLSGASANTYTGVTTVNHGTLVLAKDGGTTAIAGNVAVGDGRGTDALVIAANEQIADTANVTLDGGNHNGEAILRLDGSSSGITETFANLSVSGNAVIDFAGGNPCSPNFLFLDSLSIAADSTLYIRNWIEFTDFLLVKITDLPNLPGILGQIQFEGYGPGSYWQEYDDTYVRITPVPEPSTYGVMLIGAGLLYFGWKRRKRASV